MNDKDIVIVEINPLNRNGPLWTATTINNRLNEIAMNASLRSATHFTGRPTFFDAQRQTTSSG